VVGEQLVVGFVRIRTQTARLVSASRIRQLLQGCMLYANDHKGAFPASLEDAAKAAEIPGEMLMNPEHPHRSPGYAYIRPADGTEARADRVVIYGAFKTWSEGTNVGFGDGHVEWVSDEAAFDKMLNEAKQHEAK